MSDLTKLIDPEIILWKSAVEGYTGAGATEVSHGTNLPSGITGNFFVSFVTPAGDVAHAYVPPAAATDTKLGDSSADATKLKFITDTGFDITALTGSPIDLPNATQIRANVDQVIIRMFLEAFLGTIATGGQGFIIGDETDSSATIYHKTSGTTVGFIRKNVTTGKVQLSNDGSSWFDADNAGVGVIVWGDGLSSTNGNADPYVDLDGTAPFLTGGTNAESNFATWAAVTDGSFRITIDGQAYNVDGVNFSGDASMADVASTIQTALRGATGGLETVAWSTNKFVITSGTTRSTSEVSVTSTSTGTVGTDISGAGASDWMDCDTGNGAPTAVALTSGLEISSSKLRVKTKAGGGINRDADGLSVNEADLAVVQDADFTAKGSIISSSGASAPVQVVLGTDGQALVADSTESAGVKWDNVKVTTVKYTTANDSKLKTGGATTGSDSLDVVTALTKIFHFELHLRLTANDDNATPSNQETTLRIIGTPSNTDAAVIYFQGNSNDVNSIYEVESADTLTFAADTIPDTTRGSSSLTSVSLSVSGGTMTISYTYDVAGGGANQSVALFANLISYGV